MASGYGQTPTILGLRPASDHAPILGVDEGDAGTVAAVVVTPALPLLLGGREHIPPAGRDPRAVDAVREPVSAFGIHEAIISPGRGGWTASIESNTCAT